MVRLPAVKHTGPDRRRRQKADAETTVGMVRRRRAGRWPDQVSSLSGGAA
jgi:hypothetical protein